MGEILENLQPIHHFYMKLNKLTIDNLYSNSWIHLINPVGYTTILVKCVYTAKTTIATNLYN